MTDEPTDDEQTNYDLDEATLDDDVSGALDDAGYVDLSGPDEDSDDDSAASAPSDSGVAGKLSKLTELSGTGKDLDSYENDPIASIFDTDDGEDTHKGAKHIARGVDGLSPLAATNPLIDIGVGFVLLSADDATNGGLFGGGDDSGADDESAYESEDGGEMLT